MAFAVVPAAVARQLALWLRDALYCHAAISCEGALTYAFCKSIPEQQRSASLNQKAVLLAVVPCA